MKLKLTNENVTSVFDVIRAETYNAEPTNTLYAYCNDKKNAMALAFYDGAEYCCVMRGLKRNGWTWCVRMGLPVSIVITKEKEEEV